MISELFLFCIIESIGAIKKHCASPKSVSISSGNVSICKGKSRGTDVRITVPRVDFDSGVSSEGISVILPSVNVPSDLEYESRVGIRPSGDFDSGVSSGGTQLSKLSVEYISSKPESVSVSGMCAVHVFRMYIYC